MGEIKLFISYLIIGVIATSVDITFLHIFTEYMGIWYIYSVIFSYFIGATIHYTLNKYLNFKNNSKKIFLQFGMFLTFSLIGLLMNIIIIYILVEFIQLWYIYSKIIATTIAFFSNYFFNRKITFELLQ